MVLICLYCVFICRHTLHVMYSYWFLSSFLFYFFYNLVIFKKLYSQTISKFSFCGICSFIFGFYLAVFSPANKIFFGGFLSIKGLLTNFKFQRIKCIILKTWKSDDSCNTVHLHNSFPCKNLTKIRVIFLLWISKI